MYGETSPAPAGPPATAAARNQRYTYLVGRLRNRQMTMEEALELFAIMDGMLRASEAARAASLRLPAPASPSSPPPVAKPPPAGGATGADDLFLVGLLAMGAGAGLLAAMTKRIQDLTAPPTAPKATGTNSKSTSP